MCRLNKILEGLALKQTEMEAKDEFLAFSNSSPNPLLFRKEKGALWGRKIPDGSFRHRKLFGGVYFCPPPPF